MVPDDDEEDYDYFTPLDYDENVPDSALEDADPEDVVMLSPRRDDSEEETPLEREIANEYAEMRADPDYGIPEDDFLHSSNELSVEEFTDNLNAQIEDEQERLGIDFNPDEENRESEDMAGDSADERSESYDNWDYDAADGE